MTKVEIKVRASGPYKVTGPVRVLDAAGRELDLAPYAKNGNIALCRCGGSTTKPFCDGTHTRISLAASRAAVEERTDTVRN